MEVLTALIISLLLLGTHKGRGEERDEVKERGGG